MAEKKVEILSIINKLDAGTIKALLVATIPLLALIAHLFGVDEAVFNAKASVVTEIILALVTAGGIAWAAWARLFNPTPPLTETAKEKTLQAVAANDLKTTAHIVDTQGGFAKLPMLIAILAGALMLGCAATQAVKVAETPEQRAGALIGDFEVIQIAAKYVGSDQTVPADIRAKVLDAVIAAKPAVDQLDGLLRSYLQIETDLAAGTGTQAKLTIAAGKLSSWILEVAPKLSALQKLIKGAHP